MRKTAVIFAILPLLFLKEVHAQGARYWDPSPVYQDTGRDPISFNVTCSSFNWDVAKASDTITRDWFIQAPSTNTTNVGILFSSLASTTSFRVVYDTATVGLDLSPGASILTGSTRSFIYCRVPASASPQVLKGYYDRDRGDYGNVGALGLQR